VISQKTLTAHKLDSASLKPLFEAKTKKPGVKKLLDLIRDRVTDGRKRSLKDHRMWAAVDLAYDAPFNQITPTILRAIMGGEGTAAQIRETVKSWKLNEREVFCCKPGAGPNGTDLYELNAPAFVPVTVPLVRAYLTVRVAKLFNDRNLNPLHSYEPLKSTTQNKIRCEIVTDAAQAMTVTMGHRSSLRQMIFNSCMYSVALMFPREPWYTEEQEGEDGKMKTVRQGTRHVLPHITREFWDQQYPPDTFNTDTGCTFGGHWGMMRYGDVARNKDYWNKEDISYGQIDWLSPTATWANYFKQAYPCTEQVPVMPKASTETDRQDIATKYIETDYDKGVFVTYLFMKLVPKDWDLGDYDKPVWFGLTVASDDTVIFADSYSYSPIIYDGYDSDQNRGLNASLALEILWAQDLLSNLLTQVHLTTKHNLWKLVLYDVRSGAKSAMEALEKKDNWEYQGPQIVPFDSAQTRVGMVTTGQNALQTVTFPQGNTAEMMATINVVTSLLERTLVISPQEIGAAASHQQSVKEVQITSVNTTNRLKYTASFTDDAIDAWKRQKYEAMLAHAPREFIAQVSSDIPDLDKHLEDLGFDKVEDLPDHKKTIVKGKTENLKIEGFVSQREGPDRQDDARTAQAGYLAIQAINQNPMVAQILDPTSVLEQLEILARKAGADADFKIRTNKDAQTSQQLVQAVEQIKAAIFKDVGEQIAKPAAEAIGEQKAMNLEQQKAIIQQGEQIAELAKAVERIQALAQAALPIQPPDMMSQASSVAAAGGVTQPMVNNGALVPPLEPPAQTTIVTAPTGSLAPSMAGPV